MFVAVYKSGGHQYCRLSETYRDENGKVKTKVTRLSHFKIVGKVWFNIENMRFNTAFAL